MDPNKDAYGQEIWAYYLGKPSFEIVERDDEYIDLSPGGKLYFAEYNDWPEFEKTAMKYVKGRVLDIGCGAGRHSLYLQEKGLDVLGLDNSPLAVKVCKERGLKNVKIMSIDEISQLKPNLFNTIIMMGNNFGLLGDFNKAKILLKKFHEITSSQAIIIASSNDPYKTDNPFHLEYQELNRKKGRMSGQIRIRLRFLKFIGDWFDYLLVSKKVMKEILNGTGWEVKEFIDSENSFYIGIIEKI